jgi:hypothetical protein
MAQRPLANEDFDRRGRFESEAVARRLGRVLEFMRDPHDSRRALFGLTTRGLRVDRLRSGTVEAAITRALGRASARNLGAARGMLTRVALELDREVAGTSGSRRLNAAGRRGRERALPAPPSARGGRARAS